MRRLCAVIAMFVLVLSGCGGRSHSRQLVILALDTSASIEPEAMQEAFGAIEKLPSKLQRGDTLVVLPIKGDALNDAQGRIMRIRLSEHREAYDQDLRDTSKRLKFMLSELHTTAMNAPDDHTDILGSLQVIEQEIRLHTADKTRIVLLSDFIEDDDQINFMTAPELTSTERARNFATLLSKRTGLNFRGATIDLGHLRSRDMRHLLPSRRSAIESFWMEFLATSKGKAELYEDGTGMLENFF